MGVQNARSLRWLGQTKKKSYREAGLGMRSYICDGLGSKGPCSAADIPKRRGATQDARAMSERLPMSP